MSRSRSIAIVFHRAIRPDQMSKYRIWHCAQQWKAMGIDVQLQVWNSEPVHADLVIPQIDLSVLGREYDPLLTSPSPVVNRAVVDIQKSSFSRNLVSLDDDYQGPVIIKTDANAGGFSEKRERRKVPLGRRFIEGAGRVSLKVANTLRTLSLDPLVRTETIRAKDYPVFPSKAEVPRGVFLNPYLIVERFLPEREGEDYFLRSYSFFGDKGLSVRTRSGSPVIKGATGSELEVVSDDPAILAERKRLGFDYGKFDYVVHEGTAVLIDVNYTPTFGAAYAPEMREQVSSRLASGISHWFDEFTT